MGRGESFVIFEIDGHRLAVAVDRVERVVPIVEATPLPGAPPAVRGLINLHGDLLPVLGAGELLGLPRRRPRITDRLLIARTRRRRIALAVDTVPGLERFADADVFSRGAVLPEALRIAGAAAVPEGVIVIHDPDRFMSLDEERRLDAALDRHKEANAARGDNLGAPSDR